MTHRGGEIARVETNGNMVEFEGVSGSIDTRNDRLAIMNISWCRVCINDDTVTSIYDAMVEVEEALWLLIAYHKTAVRVSTADFVGLVQGLSSLHFRGFFPLSPCFGYRFV